VVDEKQKNDTWEKLRDRSITLVVARQKYFPRKKSHMDCARCDWPLVGVACYANEWEM